jgi:hypothetical protein
VGEVPLLTQGVVQAAEDIGKPLVRDRFRFVGKRKDGLAPIAEAERDEGARGLVAANSHEWSIDDGGAKAMNGSATEVVEVEIDRVTVARKDGEGKRDAAGTAHV